METRPAPVVVIARYAKVRASLFAVGQLICFVLSLSFLIWLILNQVHRLEGLASPKVILAMIDPFLMASLIIPLSSLYFLARVMFDADYPAIYVSGRRLKLFNWWTRGIELTQLEGATADGGLLLKFRDGRSRAVRGLALREPLTEIADQLNRQIAGARQGR